MTYRSHFCRSTIGTCEKCGCEWRKHMHVTYRLETETRPLSQRLSGATDRTPASIIILIDQRITALRQESDKIRELCVKLSVFIKKNSIISFNDDIFEYLKLMLREKQQEERNAENRSAITNIEEMMARYEKELALYDVNTNHAEINVQVDISELEQFFDFAAELFQLPISGEMIQQQINQIKQARANLTPTQEIQVTVPTLVNGSALLSKLSGLVNPSETERNKQSYGVDDERSS